MTFHNFKKLFIKHLPEILTVTAVGTLIAGDVLLIKLNKKENVTKKNYILPLALHSGSVVAIVASNRVSNAQKLSLIATTSALALKTQNERKELEKHLTPDEIAKLDKVNEEIKEQDTGKEFYYLKEFGISFWADPYEVNQVEKIANKFFQTDGFVTLEDILERLHVEKRDKDKIASNIVWEYYPYSDEEQAIIFDIKKAMYLFEEGDQVECNNIYIHRIGADNLDYEVM